MNKRKNLLISRLLLSCILFTSVAGTGALAQTPVYANEAVSETLSKVYEQDNAKVSFDVVNRWPGGYQVQVCINNLSGSPIEDWYLKLSSNPEVANIWNAKTAEELPDGLLLKNAGWNEDIAGNTSVSFGYQVNKDFTGLPESVNLISEKREVSTNAVGVDYKIDADWGSGFTGTITLTNRTDVAIEDWRMDFEYERTIVNIWNAKLKTSDKSTEDTDVEVVNAGFNSVIEPNSSVSFGFSGKEGTILNEPEDIHVYSYGAFSELEKDRDSDGDGLLDSYELMQTATDPSLKDSDENGISDAEEDSDGDGLSNIQEYEYGTYPYTPDSDKDGLTDSEELITYHTNPLVADTDGDGIKDGDELPLGLNPLLFDTDRNGTKDGEEYISQHRETEIKQDEKPLFTNVSVDLDCQGNAENLVSFEDMYGLDTHSSKLVGLLSSPMEIYVDTEFSKATVNFDYDPAYLGETKEEDLCMVWYDRDHDKYELLDSTVDTENHRVSYETNHFSMYLIVDKTVFLDCFREDINYRQSEAAKGYDIVFCVDVSGSMSGSSIEMARKSLNSFTEGLIDKDRVGIVSFADSANTRISLRSIGYDTGEYKQAISSLYAWGGTNANAGILKSLVELSKGSSDEIENEKVIILIADGDINITNATVMEAISQGVRINCINVISGASQKMEDIAYATGGCYYHASTSEELLDRMKEVQGDTVDSIDTTDTDGDGLIDVYELNGMKLSNGEIVYSDPMKTDSDGDGVSDFNELGGVPTSEKVYIPDSAYKSESELEKELEGKTEEEKERAKNENNKQLHLYSCTIFHNKSNPGMRDSDGDGIPDVLDKNPNQVDALVVAGLKNDSYVQIADGRGVAFYGGDQEYWNPKSKMPNHRNNQNYNDVGCGLIACCDLELYLSLNNPEFGCNKNMIQLKEGSTDYLVTYDYYVNYVEQRENEDYHIRGAFGRTNINRQVWPIDMEKGVKNFFEKNGVENGYYVKWAPSQRGESISSMICDQLNRNIPVVSSYFSPDLPVINHPLKMVKYDGSGSCSINSHYFTITGIEKRYDNCDNSYALFYVVSSGGAKYLINSVEYDEKINYTTNILQIKRA